MNPAALNVLTAMITPSVLISACALLVLSTANRLGRVLELVRRLPDQIADLDRRHEDTAFADGRRRLFFTQMDTLAERARLIQISLTLLYVGIAAFVATSVTIGVVESGAQTLAWTPAWFSIVGTLMLLAACLVLIFEGRLAMRTVNAEMEFVRRLHDAGGNSRSKLPPKIRS